MERDVKRAKGADELPLATRKESIISDSRMELLEEEIRAKDVIIARLTKENEDLQQKLGLLTRAPVKKGAQTRYWRKEEHERFLEALEKYGQRDVKNISAFVGTRSPTQVRTHAQKYFLKQRREETAQMKSASSLARKRRVSVTNASAMDEEGEEEEDEEDEEEEDEELLSEDEDDLLGGASSTHLSELNSSRGVSDEGVNGSRRKSTRASSAGAVIKLRTQDVVAHTGNRSGSRFGAQLNDANAMNIDGMGLNKTGLMGVTAPSPSNLSKTKNDHANSPTTSRKGTPSAIAATKAFSPAPGVFGIAGNTAGGANPNSLASQTNGQLAASRAAVATLSQLPTQSPYSNYPSAYAPTTQQPYPGPNYFPFRTDIFASNEEATQFYKAVKMYEREVDRAKVLHSIKEYFLPHRSIEEISTMVDLAFPSIDPTYSAQTMAAAAAFHPLYPQGRTMSYAEPNALANFGPATVPGLSTGLSAAGASTLPKLPLPNHGLGQTSQLPTTSYSSLLGFGLESETDGNGPTLIDPSSLSSLSERMNEMVTTKSTNGTAVSSVPQGDQLVGTSTPAGSNSLGLSFTPYKTVQMESTAPSTLQKEQDKDVSHQSPTSAIPGISIAESMGSKKKENDKEDDSLMSELATLTDRPDGLHGGGLSSFVGRPLVLSPTVFGPNTTPLGLGGMTPLVPNTTPLWLISPFGLNFSSSQSPVNPYFKPPK